jgi:hypothetical protein
MTSAFVLGDGARWGRIRGRYPVGAVVGRAMRLDLVVGTSVGALNAIPAAASDIRRRRHRACRMITVKAMGCIRCARGRGTSRHLIVNSCLEVSFAESGVSVLTTAGAEPVAAAALPQLTAAAAGGLPPATVGDYRRLPARTLLPAAEQARLHPVQHIAWAQLTAWGNYDPATTSPA